MNSQQAHEVVRVLPQLADQAPYLKSGEDGSLLNLFDIAWPDHSYPCRKGSAVKRAIQLEFQGIRIDCRRKDSLYCPLILRQNCIRDN